LLHGTYEPAADPLKQKIGSPWRPPNFLLARSLRSLRLG